MIVVSGCPRSGTSLMMDCMREVFGEEQIIGTKWPFSEKIKAFRMKGDGESDHRYAMRMYLDDKRNPDRDREFQKTMDMNPNGFWECPFTVAGVYYRFGMEDFLEELEAEKTYNEPNKHICKIVSQGLARSDPRYISKIVFMMRHPRAVAKSQERLKRVFFRDDDGRPVDLSEQFQIQTPEMFINVTTSVSHWIRRHPEIPLLLVHFENLINDPLTQFTRIQEFLGTGDFTSAINRIEPKLNRSIPEDLEHDLWEEAEVVYERFCEGDYDGVIEYMSDMTRKTHREHMHWFCPRAGRDVTPRQCEVCKLKPEVRGNFKKYAIAKGIEWHKEPCPYECGFGPGEPISIEESIAKNFWIEKKETSCATFNSNDTIYC